MTNCNYYYSRKFAIVVLAAMLQSGSVDAYLPNLPKSAFSKVTLFSTTTSTDFSTFANSLDLDDENDVDEAPTMEDKPWQAKLDDLLDPSTNLADRQILLSELLTKNDQIRDDVLDALTNRKVRAEEIQGFNGIFCLLCAAC